MDHCECIYCARIREYSGDTRGLEDLFRIGGIYRTRRMLTSSQFRVMMGNFESLYEIDIKTLRLKAQT